jgi:hypothetical protein
MKREITDKVFVVTLRGNYRCWINDKQKIALEQALLAGKKFIKVDEYFFNSGDISFILPAPEIDREERIKRGDWKCQYGYWHTKGEECAHGELEKYAK